MELIGEAWVIGQPHVLPVENEESSMEVGASAMVDPGISLTSRCLPAGVRPTRKVTRPRDQALLKSG